MNIDKHVTIIHVSIYRAMFDDQRRVSTSNLPTWILPPDSQDKFSTNVRDTELTCFTHSLTTFTYDVRLG